MLTVNVLSTQGVVSWLFGGETEKLSYVSCGRKKHLFWMTPPVTFLSEHTVGNYSCIQYLLTKAFGLPSAKNKNVPNRNIPLLPRVASPFENEAANVLARGLLNQSTTWHYEPGRVLCIETVTTSPKWPQNLSNLFHSRGNLILDYSKLLQRVRHTKMQKSATLGQQWYIKAQLGMNIRLTFV